MYNLWFNVLAVYSIGLLITFVLAFFQEDRLSYRDLGFSNVRAYHRYRYIWKPLFWLPILLTKHPAYIFSETFFKHYGDECVTYEKNSGLMNFICDIIHGKNRYAHYICDMLVTRISSDAPILKNVKGEIPDRMYANIIYGVGEGRYLLTLIVMPRDLTDYIDVSRYLLDRSTCYSKEAFFQELRLLGNDAADRIARQLALLDRES